MKMRLFAGTVVALLLTQFQPFAPAACKAQALSPNSLPTAVYDLPRRFQVGQL